MLLQAYLRGGGTPEELLTTYSVKHKRHGKYPNLVQFKYDMINSPMGSPIVQECRGVILDEDDNWEVVARPFCKFFNYGEGHAKPIDWSTARVQEKLDGSLMILYHYNNEWLVASSGMPDAAGEVNGCGFSFAELFWRVWDEMGCPSASEITLLKDHTFMFELMTPYNRVVVKHAKNRLVMIGNRHTLTGKEYPVGQEEAYDEFNDRYQLCQQVVTFPLQTMADIENTFKHLDPFAQEGYVVVDSNFNRVKVKHPGYVAIHHLRDGFGPKRILEIVRQNETSELLAHFPEWTDAFNDVKGRFEGLVLKLEEVYAEHKDIPVQKDFAAAVKDQPMSGALFMLRAGKTDSIRSYLANINLNNLIDLLKIKEIEF